MSYSCRDCEHSNRQNPGGAFPEECRMCTTEIVGTKPSGFEPVKEIEE
jgi:hypothetical protein